ncbi:hypothetical protein DQ384_36595 [Sphaerisporangium album]|uniref:Uncharacterized protein n=1 Tax=Sphaerisporangium album TaxID=509200 RepID=A0A367EUQ8_9ACTN|nr:hypothetical protein [Sphaerisporangium album]RCG21137.1 hypothetical protein DQ384_36595 [Sphaerisporangium album]
MKPIEIAQTAYAAYREWMARGDAGDSPPSWGELEEAAQCAWLAGIRAAFEVVAEETGKRLEGDGE